MLGVMKSEWIKLRSLRSTWVTYAVAILLADGLGMLIVGLRGNEVHNRTDHGMFDPVSFSLHGLFFAQLAIGIVGVLLVTGEYATGSIRSSLTAVPHRTPVLVAKAVVFTVVTAIVSLVLTSVAFFVSQALLSQWHLGVGISAPGSLRAVLGSAFYLTAIGVLGLGLGFVVRNTGGAIASLFTIVLIAPLIAQALPQDWQNHINKFLPINIVETLTRTVGKADPHALSTGWGLTTLAIYAAVALGAGWLVLKRRDV